MKHLVWPLLILLIFFRYLTTRPVYHDGDTLRITTSVYTDPIILTNFQYLKISGLKVYLPLEPEISYADKIVIEGTNQKGKLNNAKIISLKKSSNLPSVRNRIIGFYEKVLPEPEAGLLSGIIFGAKGKIPSDFYDKTKLAGVAHIVTASGTNVTFVASFLSLVLFLFFPRKKAIPFVILGIILYLFVSGFDAPLIRAALMSSILFLSQEAGRLISPWRLLLFAASIMLLYNPEWLTDVGFQLSFASTAGLMLFEKKIERWLYRLPSPVRQDLSTTLAAQIGVSPILFVTFKQFNFLSPLTNVLVLWTVPPLMIIGAFAGFLSLILPALGKLILYLSYPLLWWFVSIINLMPN